MKSSSVSRFGKSLTVLAAVAALPLGTESTSAQQKKPAAKSNATPGEKSSKPTGKKPAAPGYEQHLEANLKLLTILSRYADTLAEATDAASTGLAVTRLESITEEAILAGEAIVKLGRPTPEIEGRLAKDPDLAVTSRRVAEHTRSAIESLASNDEIKPLLTPSIENFQTALNRIQQTAEDPSCPTAIAGSKPEAVATTPPAPTPAGLPAKPPGSEPAPAALASEATSVPPPPPQE
jgi:hypothetical protein